ncbi:MAG: helicase HerA-like domain-containing protein, partial [Hyphomicrobiaceae bacterium]
PLDVPDTVSSQLGNRIQHALRAYTPREQRAVRAAAETFRPNPELDTERVILELKVGEALVSFLENRGEPSIVQRTLIRPPNGQIGPMTMAQRQETRARSPIKGKYEEAVDRESAHEILKARAVEMEQQQAAAAAAAVEKKNSWTQVIFGRGPRGGRSLGEQVTRDIGRSIMRRIISRSLRSVFRAIGMR